MLNWGLGHATRSIPLLRDLADAGFEPVIASDGAALDLLRNEFPTFKSEELPAYNIRYGKKGGVLTALVWQLPNIWRVALMERRALRRLVSKYRPVGIISDNRPGFFHPDIPSVYITHQLKLMLPFARKWISGIYHRYIRNFSECWVPDFSGPFNLTGEMTSGINPGVPVHFIGPQSRFSELSTEEKSYTTCTILSGPEPQRSILEKKLIRQLQQVTGKHVFIRGTAKSSPLLLKEQGSQKSHIEVLDFLTGSELSQKINQSHIVLSRSGYSSLMDYGVLKNRALLIPTPGQPEQEYLARYMLSRGWFFYTDQQHLDLIRDLEKAMRFRGLKMEDQNARASLAENLFGLFEGEGKS